MPLLGVPKWEGSGKEGDPEVRRPACDDSAATDSRQLGKKETGCIPESIDGLGFFIVGDTISPRSMLS